MVWYGLQEKTTTLQLVKTKNAAPLSNTLTELFYNRSELFINPLTTNYRCMVIIIFIKTQTGITLPYVTPYLIIFKK